MGLQIRIDKAGVATLLPADSRCTHIGAALAIKGDKVLCSGIIDGKTRALIVTLPATDKLLPAFTD